MTRKRSKPSVRRTGLLHWLIVAALAATAVAGCLHPPDDDPQTVTIHPVVETDRDEGWTEETFRADGTATRVEGALVTEWRFDMGDGTTVSGENLSQAVVEHEYAVGGLYEILFQVYAESENGENATTEARHTLSVHERHEIQEQTLWATPLNDTALGNATYSFDVRANATRWAADVELENVGPLMDAEATLRILDADNETVAQEHVTIAPNETTSVHLDGAVTGPGEHRMEIVVEESGVHIEGTLRVYYGAP